MTLIIATIAPRGAVLAADRRSIATPNKGGDKFVMTDTQTKLMIGPDMAIALLGNSSNGPINAGRMVETWLDHSYDQTAPFQTQLLDLFQEISHKLPKAGLIAVRYRDGLAEYCKVSASHEPEYVSVSTSDVATVKPTGSGAELAKQVIELYRPPLAAFDLQQVVDYSAFIIRTTHGLQYYGNTAEPTVGAKVSAAVCDYNGAQMVIGRSYFIDEPAT